MSFVAECPFCSHRVRIPEKGYAASITCPKCRDGYTAVPVTGDPETSEGEMPEPITTTSTAVQEAPAEEDKSIPKMGLPATAKLTKKPPTPTFTPVTPPEESQIEVEEIEEDEEEEFEESKRSILPPIHWTSAVSILLASFSIAAIPFRSLCFLVFPFSFVGLILGAAGPCLLYKTNISRLVSGVGAIICGFLCLAIWLFPSLLGPVYLAYTSIQPEDPNVIHIVPFPGEENLDAKYEAEGVDASKAALKKGNLWMRITRVTFEKEKRSKSDKTDQPAKSFLMVRLLVQRVGSGTQFADNTTWSQFTKNQRPKVKLLDNTGKISYPQFRVGELKRTTTPKEKEPNKKENTATLFPVSADDPTYFFSAPKDQPFFRLIVSLSAWGQDGEFRFKIPKGMIQSPQDLPLLNAP